MASGLPHLTGGKKNQQPEPAPTSAFSLPPLTGGNGGASYSLPPLTAGQPAQASAPKKKHRGLLGDIGHFIADKTDRAARDLKGIPSGIVDLATYDAHAVADTIKHPIAHGKRAKMIRAEWSDLFHGHPIRAFEEPNNPKWKGVATKTDLEGAALGGGLARSSVEAVKHPLRDPFQTAITVLPAASAALRGAEIARGVDINAPRALKAGSAEAPLIRSRSALGRTAQSVYDSRVQKALTRNDQGQATGRVSSRLAAHGQKRIGGALDEQARIQARQKATPAAMLDRAASKLAKTPKTRREQQAALELTSVQSTPSEAAAYHRAQAAAGVNPKLNRAVAHLYDRVGKRDLVHLDESRPAGERVFINPEFPKLVAADKALARVQQEGDRILAEKNVRPEEQLAARRDAPGRVRAGATFENPTPGKLGKPSSALLRQRAYVARLETLHERALSKAAEKATPYPNVHTRTGFVKQDLKTAPEAALKRQHVEVAPGPKTPGAPSAMPAKGAVTPTTERLGAALSVARDKLAQMEAAAERRVKPTGLVGGETARPGRGYLSEQISEKKLGRAEQSPARPPVVGAAQSPVTAKTYTGRALAQGFRPKHVTASASRHMRAILKFENTDLRRRAALATGSVTRRSSRDILVREPDVNVKTLAEKIAKEQNIPIGRAKRIAAEQMRIGPEIQQALGRETSSVDTLDELAAHDAAVQEGLRAAHQAFKDRMLDRAEQSKAHAIGTEAPAGYKWVDRGALGDIAKPGAGPRGKIARTVDSVNSAVTAATVYFKIGHLGTRLFTDAATNIIQGSAAPLEVKRSVEMWHQLTPEEQARALAAAGQHGFSALPHEGSNLVSLVAGRGASWWAKHIDAPFRFNALAYELRKIGVTTPAKFRQALGNLQSGGDGMPAHEWSRLSAAARRADREAISYDRLNDFERRYLTRAIWFYPWIKGSTLFTVRTAIEHPVKSGVLGAAGVQGRKQQLAELGPTPSYEAGLFRFGHRGSHPLVTDFSTFSPFSTPADLAKAVTIPGGIAGLFNPVLGAGVEAATGTNSYGNKATSYLDALQALGSPTPEQQLWEAWQAQHQNQTGRMFPKSLTSTLLRYLLGPATPRHVNESALVKAAARERSGR